MTDHYREAEELLASAARVILQADGSSPEADRLIAEAQVHATLALVDATAGTSRVDPTREGCVDHLPAASRSCRDCAQRQGVAR
ncbi:hypothetical protein [Streptosporangium sp. NPDC004631]